MEIQQTKIKRILSLEFEERQVVQGGRWGDEITTRGQANISVRPAAGSLAAAIGSRPNREGAMVRTTQTSSQCTTTCWKQVTAIGPGLAFVEPFSILRNTFIGHHRYVRHARKAFERYLTRECASCGSSKGEFRNFSLWVKPKMLVLRWNAFLLCFCMHGLVSIFILMCYEQYGIFTL